MASLASLSQYTAIRKFCTLSLPYLVQEKKFGVCFVRGLRQITPACVKCTHTHNLDAHTLTHNDLCNVRFQSSYFGLSALLLGTVNDWLTDCTLHPQITLYKGVVDDVIKNVKDEFLNDEVDQQVLEELKQVWTSPVTVQCLSTMLGTRVGSKGVNILSNVR